MAEPSGLGTRMRTLRRQANLSQVKLAEKLGISPSYLNLIEHGRRRLPAELMFRAADVLHVDVRSFVVDDAASLLADLMEALDDPELEDVDIKAEDVRTLVHAQPGIGRAFTQVYKRWKAQEDDLRKLRAASASSALEGVDTARLPSEEVNDLVGRHMNHFEDVETIAELFWRRYGLTSARLFEGLAQVLRDSFQVEVRVGTARSMGGMLRRFDPDHRVLTLSETLAPRSRHFHMAHQIGLLALDHVVARLAEASDLTTDASRRLARMVMGNYFAGCMLMPYERFWEAAESERYDLELLGHRFRTSYEQVCHRLTSMRRPGMEGVPFHLVKADLAGNVTKRFGGSGIQLPRSGGGCPLWGVHAAVLQPGRFHLQVSEMPDGARYFVIARTVHKRQGGYNATETVHSIELGCRLEHAHRLVYADGLDLDALDVVPVGINCRVCERAECEQRAFPSVRHALALDENVRHAAFYATAPKEER